DLGQGGGGPDRGRVTVHADAVQVRDRGQVDERVREGQALALHPVLHDPGDDVAAAAERARLRLELAQDADRVGDVGRLVKLEALHGAPSPPSAPPAAWRG